MPVHIDRLSSELKMHMGKRTRTVAEEERPFIPLQQQEAQIPMLGTKAERHRKSQ
jgi:hypothetical protein